MSLAFQAGVAGRLDDVVETMRLTHDSLVTTWGGKRRGGIFWKVYGGPMAGVLAARHAISATVEPAGDLAAGFEHLRQLLDVSGDTIPPNYLEEMEAFAGGEVNPTLVIAYCKVKPGRPQIAASNGTRT